MLRQSRNSTLMAPPQQSRRREAAGQFLSPQPSTTQPPSEPRSSTVTSTSPAPKYSLLPLSPSSSATDRVPHKDLARQRRGGEGGGGRRRTRTVRPPGRAGRRRPPPPPLAPRPDWRPGQMKSSHWLDSGHVTRDGGGRRRPERRGMTTPTTPGGKREGGGGLTTRGARGSSGGSQPRRRLREKPLETAQVGQLCCILKRYDDPNVLALAFPWASPMLFPDLASLIRRYLAFVTVCFPCAKRSRSFPARHPFLAPFPSPQSFFLPRLRKVAALSLSHCNTRGLFLLPMFCCRCCRHLLLLRKSAVVLIPTKPITAQNRTLNDLFVNLFPCNGIIYM
jgi:hypothetical protein